MYKRGSVKLVRIIGIGSDRAYSSHFTHPRLLLLQSEFAEIALNLNSGNGIGMEFVSFCFWSLSVEMIEFQPSIILPHLLYDQAEVIMSETMGTERYIVFAL